MLRTIVAASMMALFVATTPVLAQEPDPAAPAAQSDDGAAAATPHKAKAKKHKAKKKVKKAKKHAAKKSKKSEESSDAPASADPEGGAAPK